MLPILLLQTGWSCYSFGFSSLWTDVFLKSKFGYYYTSIFFLNKCIKVIWIIRFWWIGWSSKNNTCNTYHSYVFICLRWYTIRASRALLSVCKDWLWWQCMTIILFECSKEEMLLFMWGVIKGCLHAGHSYNFPLLCHWPHWVNVTGYILANCIKLYNISQCSSTDASLCLSLCRLWI